MKKIFTAVVVGLFSLSLINCSSTTMVRTTDNEAKIYIDGEYRGKGMVSHTDMKILGSVTQVKIEKEGCEPMMYTFAKNEEFDAGACAGGVFVLVPFLWIQKYKADHIYEYSCVKKK